MLGEWLRRRREREAEHEAARQRLYEEFQQRVEEQDADALEAARDYGDNDRVPWRVEVGQSLAFVAMLGLMAVVAVLIVLFLWIKHLTGG